MATQIAIIGGGASGSLAAIHLAKKIDPSRIVVVESRSEVARGIAYSTTEPTHLLNVRAANMSAFADDATDFVSWLSEKEGKPVDGAAFLPRMTWGAYVAERFAATGVRVVRGRVTRLDVSGPKIQLHLDDGHTLEADQAVLAMGHALPVEIGQVDDAVAASGRYVRSVWSGWLRQPGEDEPIILVGSGLTAVDVLLRLRAGGHKGVVTMISRHGLLTQPHGPVEAVPPAVIPADAPPSARMYLHYVRAAMKDGLSWRACVDSLRGCSNTLWQRLPLPERLRFRRHLFHRWHTARHRMAPEIAARISEEIAAGSLIVRKGHVASLSGGEQGLMVRVKTQGGEVWLRAEMVMNCTAPDTDFLRAGDPLFTDLFAGGLAVSGALGTAFATDDAGALVGVNGQTSPVLHAIGPLRAGGLFETTAIPEIRQQAQALAAILSSKAL